MITPRSRVIAGREYASAENGILQGGAQSADGGTGEVPESVPSRLNDEALKAVGLAEAEARKALAQLEDKTNGIIDKAGGALNKFVDTADEMRAKVVKGLDTAIAAVETPLLALAPILREIADTALDACASAAGGIPEMVRGQIDGMKGPLVEQIKSQIDTIAEAAIDAIGSVEDQIQEVKDQVLEEVASKIDLLAEKVTEISDSIAPRIQEVIDRLMEKFTEVYEGKPLFDEIHAQLEETCVALKEAADTLLGQVIETANATIKGVRDDAIRAVNETFEQLFAAAKALPDTIRNTLQGIVANIDKAIDETLNAAQRVAEELMQDLRKRLEDVANLVADTVETIISDGFRLIREARDVIVNTASDVISTVRVFINETLGTVKDESNKILTEGYEAVDEGFGKVKTSITECVEGLGEKLNTKITETQDDMRDEAEKAAKDILDMGDDAFDKSEQKFVDDGYEEDTEVIPDIREEGDKAIQKIEMGMEKAIKKLETEFELQFKLNKTKFKVQGKLLEVKAKATTLKVVALALKIGPKLAMDIVAKAGEFADKFSALGDTISDLVNGKGTAFVDNAKTSIMDCVEAIKTTGIEFVETAKSSVTELIDGTKARFESLVESIENDVMGLVDNVTGMVTTCATDTKDRFVKLYEDSKTRVETALEETFGAIEDFIEECEQIIDEAIQAAIEIGLKLLEELKRRAIEEIKKRIEKFLDQIRKRYLVKIEAAFAKLGEKEQRYEQMVLDIDVHCDAADLRFEQLKVLIAEVEAKLQAAQDQLLGAMEPIEHVVEEDCSLKAVLEVHDLGEDPRWAGKVWFDDLNAEYPKKESPRNQRIPEVMATLRANPDYLFRGYEAGETFKVLQNLYFDTDSPVPRPESKALLTDELAPLLIAHPEVKVFEVQGHCDRRPTNRAGGNKKLSQDRADMVVLILQAAGVKQELVAKGYGHDEPAKGFEDDSLESYAKCRRVEIKVLELDPAFDGWTGDVVWIRDWPTITTCEAQIATLTSKLQILRETLRTESQEWVYKLQTWVQVGDAETSDVWDCLRKVFEKVIADGKEALGVVGTRIRDEVQVLAGDTEAKVEDVAEELKGLRDELAGELREHAQTMQSALVKEHQLQLNSAIEGCKGGMLIIEQHLDALFELLKPSEDPMVLIDKLRDEWVPQLEDYLYEVVQLLLECYSERLANAVPVIRDVIELLTDAIKGNPLSEKALEFLKQHLLPVLDEKTNGLISGVTDKLEGVNDLGDLLDKAKAEAQAAGANVLDQIGARAEEAAGNAAGAAADAAAAAQDAVSHGAQQIANQASDAMNASQQLAEAANSATGALAEDMAAAKDAADSLNEAANVAQEGLNEVAGSAEAAAAEAADACEGAADEIAEAGDMSSVFDAAGDGMDAAHDEAVDSVTKAGEEAKKGIQEGMNQQGLGSGEDVGGGFGDAEGEGEGGEEGEGGGGAEGSGSGSDGAGGAGGGADDDAEGADGEAGSGSGDEDGEGGAGGDEAGEDADGNGIPDDEEMGEDGVTKAAAWEDEDSDAEDDTEFWAKFRVVDDSNGKPIRGVTLRLELSDGSTQEFKTNKKGQIDAQDLPEGAFKIVGLIDKKGYEVVSMKAE